MSRSRGLPTAPPRRTGACMWCCRRLRHQVKRRRSSRLMAGLSTPKPPRFRTWGLSQAADRSAWAKLTPCFRPRPEQLSDYRRGGEKPRGGVSPADIVCEVASDAEDAPGDPSGRLSGFLSGRRAPQLGFGAVRCVPATLERLAERPEISLHRAARKGSLSLRESSRGGPRSTRGRGPVFGIPRRLQPAAVAASEFSAA